MVYLKTYELFNGGRILNALKKDIIKSTEKWNDLMDAIANKEYKTFRKLIKTSNLEEVDKNGNTALMIASMKGRVKMTKLLIDNGANIFHSNNQGKNFYDVAINDTATWSKKSRKFINGVKNWIEENYPEIVMSNKYNL